MYAYDDGDSMLMVWTRIGQMRDPYGVSIVSIRCHKAKSWSINGHDYLITNRGRPLRLIDMSMFVCELPTSTWRNMKAFTAKIIFLGFNAV